MEAILTRFIHESSHEQSRERIQIEPFFVCDLICLQIFCRFDYFAQGFTLQESQHSHQTTATSLRQNSGQNMSSEILKRMTWQALIRVLKKLAKFQIRE